MEETIESLRELVRKNLRWLIEPDLAVFSVGKNDYGHPTKSTLDLIARVGALSLRTDLSGSVGIHERDGELRYFLAGKLSA